MAQSHGPGHPNYGGHSPLHKRKKPPSQASGQAPAPYGPGQGPVASLDKKVKKKAKNIGNALLPGNPFG